MFNSVQQSISGPFGGAALAIGLSVLGVTADTLLKAASQHSHPFLNAWFVLGCLSTLAFAVGWVFLMQVMKLGTAGVIYAVTSSLLLVAVGYLVYGERLNSAEITGVAMAVGAFFLLGRLL
jgi:drug/metabolite transporter (DMT)-like permease